MNVAILIGRLTRDPELKYVPSTGKAVAHFTIAVDRPYTSKSGERMTDFFNIVVWGKQAENCANYIAKGRLVGIKGTIENRSYESQNGEKRYITEIIAENVQFLEWGERNQTNSRPTGVQSNYQNYQGGAAPVFEPSGYGDTPQSSPNSYEPKGFDAEGYRELEDDDVPF